MISPELFLSLLVQKRRLALRENWTRRRLDNYRHHALQRLREYAYSHSPFYAKFHKGLQHRPLCDLPALTKEILTEHFNELVTDSSIRLSEVEAHAAALSGDERFLGRYWVNATSGSTGRRGFFLFNTHEWATAIAGFGRANFRAGFGRVLLHRKRIGVVASRVPWHMSTRAVTSLKNPWSPVLHLDAREPTSVLVKSLNGWTPHMLAGYPSSLRILAREQLAGSLHIHPAIIYAGGEVLSEDTRRSCYQAWGADIFDQYGATETGNIAAECPHHQGLHVNEDLLIVEAVDEANRPVPPGTFGEKLLVTVLFNRTQPLIRYELTDRVRFSISNCSCGRSFSLIDALEGRSEEMLRFPSLTGGREVSVHPLVLEHLLERLPVSEWQVIQERDRLVVLLAGLKKDFDAGLAAETVAGELKVHGAAIPVVEVHSMAALPRTITGKISILMKNKSSESRD